MKSIWNEEVNRPASERLTGDIKTDVLIIGGGITGILCAYMLKESGVDCVLVEADKICSGITGNTTAKITCQHGLIYDKMIKRFGVDYASLYMQAQNEALEHYRNLCKKIDCDFEERDSFVYSKSDFKKIEREAEAIAKIGVKSKFTTELPLPFPVAGAVGIENQAQFNPLKFAFSIAENVRLFENTGVKEFRPDCVVTAKGRIKAKSIIVATHFPLLNKHGSYFLKMYQHRSYVTAFRNIPRFNGMYVDEDKKGMSFRSYGDIALIGGGGHRTGKKGGNWREINAFAEKYYPDAIEVCRFATQDCMTLDDIAYIGQYSKNTPSLYVATGFNKWGMTSAMVSAIILNDLVQGRKNRYSEIFSPSRSVFRPQLAVNIAESTIGLLTPTAPRCPHLGCALKYNKAEHSWDCPCHGSRFSEKGELIDNPSDNDMN